MNIGEKIRRLRQEAKLSQTELAQKIGVHQKQISSYERGVNLPSTEILVKLAENFNVTLDYLAFEAKQGMESQGYVNIQDRELLRRFESLDQLSETEKKLAKELLDLIIFKGKFSRILHEG